MLLASAASAAPAWAADVTGGLDIVTGGSLDTTGNVTDVSQKPAVRSTGSIVSFLNEGGGNIFGTKSTGVFIGYNGSVDSANAANVASFVNHGTIRGGDASYAGALRIGGDVGDFSNDGTIAATRYDTIYITGNVTGTFTNALNGSITGDSDDVLVFHGTVATFVNAGTIRNTAADSGDDALVATGRVGSLNNSGTIEAANGEAVWLRNGADSIVNSGTLSGTTGIVVSDASAAAVHVTNSGRIVGSSGTAMLLTDNNDAVTLVTGSTTTGIVDGRGSGDTDTLVLDGTTSGSFAISQLVNFEAITKQGTGKWSLSGDNAAAMVATIEAGLLSIDGDMHNTAITVNGGGTLGGNGTVGAVDVRANGHVAPGNSVGTLHTGAIVFSNDSFYDVEIDGATADRIVAAGTAFIGSNVTLNVTGTPAACGNLSLPILTSTGRTGTFSLSTLLSNVSLSYDATSAYLDISNGVGRLFTGFTNTPNQASTAAALDAMGCASQPYAAQLAALSDAEVPAAMDALSGAGHAGVAGALVEGSQALPQAINSRIEQAFAALDTRGMVSAYGAGPMLLGQIEGVTVWGAGYGGLAAQAGNGNAMGWQSGASGFVLGADGKVNEDVRLGVLGGIGITGIGAQALTGSSTDVSGGVYGGARLGVVTLKAGAAYTRHLIQTSRSIVFPGVSDTVTASYAAGTAQLFAELSRDFAVGGMTLTPFARVDAVNHATDAFTETGGEGQLHSAASVVNALFVTLGVAGEDKFVLGDTLLVTARGSLGWRHAFGGGIDIANNFAGSGPFGLSGTAVASDAAVLEASAVLDLSESTSLSLGYSGMLGSGLASGGLTATLAGRF